MKDRSYRILTFKYVVLLFDITSIFSNVAVIEHTPIIVLPAILCIIYRPVILVYLFKIRMFSDLL